MRLPQPCLALLLLPLALPAARGVETEVTTTIGDTWLRGGGNNFGANDSNNADDEVLVGTVNGAGNLARGILEFDLSPYSLQAGDSISAARLELVVNSEDATVDPGPLDLELRFVDDGGESADLFNGTSWNDRSKAVPPVPWSTPGGVYGATLKGSVAVNPATVTGAETVSLPLDDLTGIEVGGPLQFGLLCPEAEALSNRTLFRFHSTSSPLGEPVAAKLVLTTSQPLDFEEPPEPLLVGGTEVISTDTTVANALVGSGADGVLVIDGGNLTVTGSMNLGTSAPFRDGVLEQIDGSVDIAGNLDFSSNFESGSVLKVWNPGANAPIAAAGELLLERVVLRLAFDDTYSHSPGATHTLATYASRTGHFENVPAGGEITMGENRFRIDYDADAGGGLLAITATALENHPQLADAPNVIFIMVDDQGYGELTPYGAAANRTPALEVLAEQGMLFTDGYAVASVCSPTRGGLITGRYCESVGHRLNIAGGREGQGLSPTFKTYMERLASVGYRNYWVGKWYAGSSVERDPLYRGADRFFTIADSLSHLAGDDILEEDGVELGPSTQYLTDHMGDKVVEYIAGHLAEHPDRPFHVHWSEYAPHSPFRADPARLEQLFGVKGSYSTAERIAGMNLAIDDNIRKVRDFLDDPDGDPSTDDGIAGNTLIVYTNDNGGTPSHNNAVLRGVKGDQYEGGIRIPMIARWPDGGWDPSFLGSSYGGPTHMLDWIATICSAAGVPACERNELDGIDLTPYLTGAEPHPVERPLFWNLWPRWYNDPNPATPAGPDGGRDMAGGMRQGDWKLMVSENLEVTELYHLPGDPGEATNVKAANPAIHDAMFATYLQWQRGHVVPMWQDGLNTNVYTPDDGLYLRALSNSYRLSTREHAAKYFTAEARPFFDLAGDFEAYATLQPRSAGDLTAHSAAWLVFGFTEPSPGDLGAPPAPPDRNKLCRIGIDFAAETLVVEDLNTATSSSVPLPADWNPAGGAAIGVRFNGSTRELTATAEGVSTSIVLPAGVDVWENFGFGVRDCEVECFLLRDTTHRSGAWISDLQWLGNNRLSLDLKFLHPSNRPVRIEDSTDLIEFEKAEDALIERFGPGRFRINIDNPGNPAQRFFRGAD